MQRQPRIPWKNIQEYIELHDKNFKSLMSLETEGLMTKEEIELRIHISFSKINDYIQRTLIETNFIQEERKRDVNNIKAVLKAAFQVQQAFLYQSGNTQGKVSAEFIQKYKANIFQKISNLVKNEDFDQFLVQLAEFSDILQENISLINLNIKEIKDRKINQQDQDQDQEIEQDKEVMIEKPSPDLRLYDKIAKLSFNLQKVEKQNEILKASKVDNANIKYYTAVEQHKVDMSTLKTQYEGQIKKLELEIGSLTAANQDLKNKVKKLLNNIFQVQLNNKTNKPGALACYKFYEDLDSLQINDFQFKKDFKWKIIHPYDQEIPILPIEEIPQYEVTLKMCTVYKGVPEGPAHIYFEHPDAEGLSFEGVGVFTHGQLHGGPFIFIRGDNWSHSYELMMNGRPADGANATYFWPQGDTLNVNSLTEKTDVSGWQGYSGQLKDAFRHRQGKVWLTRMRTFTGEFERGLMKQGTLNELQKDGTVNISTVTYKSLQDSSDVIWPSHQKPIKQDFIDKGCQFLKLKDYGKK